MKAVVILCCLMPVMAMGEMNPAIGQALMQMKDNLQGAVMNPQLAEVMKQAAQQFANAPAVQQTMGQMKAQADAVKENPEVKKAMGEAMAQLQALKESIMANPALMALAEDTKNKVEAAAMNPALAQAAKQAAGGVAASPAGQKVMDAMKKNSKILAKPEVQDALKAEVDKPEIKEKIEAAKAKALEKIQDPAVQEKMAEKMPMFEQMLPKIKGCPIFNYMIRLPVVKKLDEGLVDNPAVKELLEKPEFAPLADLAEFVKAAQEEPEKPQECMTSRGPCVFPFKAQGQMFETCAGAGAKRWCATSVYKWSRQWASWAYCPEECA